MRIWPSVLIVAALAAPAQAFDCGEAATPVEKAICADDGLMALDGQMAAAYGEVRKLSTDDERRMLALSQKAWIDGREAGCGGQVADLAAQLTKLSAQVEQLQADGETVGQ